MAGTGQTNDAVSIRLDRDGELARLVIAGDLDMNVDDWLGCSLRAASELSEPIELDLGGVTFMDSSSLAALLALVQKGRTLNTIAISPAVERLLELTGLTGAFGLPAVG